MFDLSSIYHAALKLKEVNLKMKVLLALKLMWVGVFETYTFIL